MSRTFSFSEFRSFGPQCWPKGTRMSLLALRDMKRGAPGGANKPRLNCALACVASVSVRFRSKQRGTRVKDRAKNGGFGRARKETRAKKWKSGEGVGKRGHLLLPLPPLSFFRSCFISRAAKTENPVPVFLYSETKRKRLLRRLTVT